MSDWWNQFENLPNCQMTKFPLYGTHSTVQMQHDARWLKIHKCEVTPFMRKLASSFRQGKITHMRDTQTQAGTRSMDTHVEHSYTQ